MAEEFVKGPCVYVITHEDTGAFYLGSCKNMGARYGDHLRVLKQGRHHSRLLQQLYDQNPNIRLEYEPVVNRDEGFAVEQLLLNNNKDNPGLLNSNVKTGYRDEVLNQRLSEQMKNRSEELKVRSIQALRDNQPHAEHWIGKKHRPETIAKMKAGETEGSKAQITAMVERTSRPVIVDGIEYPSVSEASRSLGIHHATLSHRIHSDRPTWSEFRFKD